MCSSVSLPGAAHGSSHAAEERGFHIQDDLIDLPHIADAEGCQNGKNGEQNRKDAADGLAVLPAAQTVIQVVHRTSRPRALTVAAAAVDAQHIIGEIGHHPEKGRNPHPEHRAGAAGEDRAGNADDDARADLRGDGGGERLERAHTAAALLAVEGDVAEDAVPALLEAADLHEFCLNGVPDADAEQQKDQNIVAQVFIDGLNGGQD